MTIEELFGTLQMSVVSGWRKHLRTAKYGKHKALQEFYEEMPDKVDALIEGWMGAHGKKVGAFQNILSASNMNTLKYLQELKRVCKEGYDLMDEHEELEGLLDDIVNLINSTLYKVKELSESKMKDLKDYVNEALAIPKKFNETFTYDDLGLEDEEVKFLKKYLNTDTVYQLPEFDKDGHGISQFSRLYELLNKSKELEVFGDYTAYKLPKGTITVLYTAPEYQGLVFYLAANKINESLINEAKNCFGDVAQFVAGGWTEPDVMDEKTFVKGFDWKKLAKKSNSKYDGDHLGYYAPLNHLKDEINALSTFLFSLDYTDYENAEEFAEYVNAEIADCLKSDLTAKCIWDMRDILVLFWKDNKAVARLVFRPNR